MGHIEFIGHEPMTNTTTLQANAFAFAEEHNFTKQQAIAFAILAIFNEGYGIARAIELVCGPKALAELSDINYTAEALLNAVQRSLFEA